MVTRVFGLFVFGKNSSVIYRFLTDDLRAHLKQCFQTRGYLLDEDLDMNDQPSSDDGELRLCLDDAISQHLSVLINVHEATSSRHDPIRRMTLQSGVQIFFDQIAENNLLCMADRSFDTVVVLKAINLFKALIRFHIGALPFMHYNVGDQLIDRISASLQYFLVNVTVNQAMLFESYEHVHMNTLIRDQCYHVCQTISNDVQGYLNVSRKVIMITCNDKVVYLHSSPEQLRPSNADIFLLLLNNTSRSHRKDFERQVNRRSRTIAHRFDPDLIPSKDPSEMTHRSEVVFMRTASKVIAPFTLFTIPLTEQMSALVLVEWENSSICSSLYELIRHLDSYTNHGVFPYTKLSPQIKLVESSGAVRRYFEQAGHAPTILSDTLAKAHALHKLSSKVDDNHRNALRILHHLTEMSLRTTDAFRHLFFDSDEYARRSGIDDEQEQDCMVQMDGVNTNDAKPRRNEYDTSPMVRKLRRKILVQLEDWFSFIEAKSQRNITMNFCGADFPGLVHFAFIDRLYGEIATPTLSVDDHLHPSACALEKKIIAFELECLAALQQGSTSYTMSDEHFIYNYTLRLQENNGASMRLYKSFVQSQPAGVLHFDFYRALADEYYPRHAYQSSIACFELIVVHLRVVPASVVREQCEQLWFKLMETEE